MEHHELMASIDAIAGKLGTTADKMWPWLIKQVYVDFGMLSVFMLILIAALIYLGKLVYYLISENEDEMMAVIILVITCIFFVITAVYWLQGVGFLINPEYGALNKLADLFTGD